MTHETTPDVWLTKRIHRIQSMLKDGAITLRHHDIAIAEAHNTHSRLLEMAASDRSIIDIKYLGKSSVIITGFKTDQKANIYATFKLTPKGIEHEQQLPIE